MTDNNQPQHEKPAAPVVAGVLAEFDDVKSLKSAAARLRDDGFQHWDVHSPFPVHGIEQAMGIRPTILPMFVLAAGITGCAAAIFLQWWTNATGFDLPIPNSLRGYPIIISGKPLFSLPANIPIAFELIILFSAITAFLGTLALNRLPQFNHPVFTSERFARATADRFFISVDAADPKYDESGTTELLTELGATAVDVVYRPAAGRKIPGRSAGALRSSRRWPCCRRC